MKIIHCTIFVILRAATYVMCWNEVVLKQILFARDFRNSLLSYFKKIQSLICFEKEDNLETLRVCLVCWNEEWEPRISL